jgi:hypothetical protein
LIVIRKVENWILQNEFFIVGPLFLCWLRLLFIQDVAMVLFLLNVSCVLLYVNCVTVIILPGNGLRNQTDMVVIFVVCLMQ